MLRKRFILVVLSLFAAGGLVAASIAGGAATRPARTGSSMHGLSAYVVATNVGPLPPCSGPDCSEANTVWYFIHVVNGNRLTNMERGTNRATVPNSFVVSSVDWRIFVNGAEVPAFDTTFTPPPNANFRSYSGHWPSTVTCPSDGTACNVVGSPAVVPGENTAVLYAGWIHGSTEPNGTYVFKYTIHGTLNGSPVDLTASSPPIQMTA